MTSTVEPIRVDAGRDEESPRSGEARRRGAALRPYGGSGIALLLFLQVASALTPSAARAAQEESLGRALAITVDAALLRPLGMLRLIGGSALLVPTTLMWPPDYRANIELFVLEPAEYLFERPLGEDLAGS